MTDLISMATEAVIGVTSSSDYENALALAEKLDFLDIQLLRKFYMSGKERPFDIQSYCLPILFNEMKITHKMKIKLNAFRYRINNLVKLGLLTKVLKSNPSVYLPFKDKEIFVRKIITKFFVLNGLMKFLWAFSRISVGLFKIKYDYFQEYL